jgi:hypothetical protein
MRLTSPLLGLSHFPLLNRTEQVNLSNPGNSRGSYWEVIAGYPQSTNLDARYIFSVSSALLIMISSLIYPTPSHRFLSWCIPGSRTCWHDTKGMFTGCLLVNYLHCINRLDLSCPGTKNKFLCIHIVLQNSLVLVAHQMFIVPTNYFLITKVMHTRVGKHRCYRALFRQCIKHSVSRDGRTFDMAARFKQTFSRDGVRVHFMGTWSASKLLYVILPLTFNPGILCHPWASFEAKTYH